MTMGKKIASRTILALVALSITYTTAWFISKTYIENQAQDYFENLMASNDIENIEFDLKIGCFPTICAELKNVKVTTSKHYMNNPAGVIMTAFSKYPLTYKTNNVFYPKIEMHKPNAKFDLTVMDKNNKIPVQIEVFVSNLDLLIKEKEGSLSASKIAVMAMMQESPLTSIIDTGFFKVLYTENTNKNLIEASISVSDLKKFNGKGQVIKNLDHLKVDAEFENLQKRELFNLAKKFKLATTIDTKGNALEEIVQNIITNKTTFKIKDFKMTDDQVQVSAKSDMAIDTETFLIGSVSASVQFLKENSPVEQMLQAAQITKNDQNIYKLKLLQTNKGGFLNDKPLTPPLEFKRTAKTKQVEQKSVKPKKTAEK